MIESPSQHTSAPRSGPTRPVTRKSYVLAIYNIGPFVRKFCSLCISQILHSLKIMSQYSRLSAPLLTDPSRCIRIFARLQEPEGASGNKWPGKVFGGPPHRDRLARQGDQPAPPPGNTAPSTASATPKSASGARKWVSRWAADSEPHHHRKHRAGAEGSHFIFSLMSPSFKSYSLKFLLLLLLGCFTGALSSRANEITLPSIHFKALGSPPFLLPANASSGLAINYQVVAGTSVASISANQVTLSGQKGAVTIKASQPGGGIWLAAEDRYLTFVVDDAPQWKKVFVGSGSPGYWSAALRDDGTIWTWGSNAAANLGISNLIFRRRPLQMGLDSDWAELAAPKTGASFAAIKADGRMFTWGLNTSGQLGDGNAPVASRIPILVNAETNWSKVASGGNHMIALKNDGSLWAWGLNSSGQLGDGTTVAKSIPTQIGTATDWVQVSAGSASSYAVKSDGSLWAWGSNSGGRLGDGTTTARTAPVRIGLQTDWVSVDGGTDHAFAIKQDGALWGWGTNTNGQIGNGTTNNVLQPAQFMPGTSWQTFYAGRQNSMAIKNDGTLWAWGLNSRGQLGDGTTTTRLSPVQIGIETDWKTAACSDHSLGIKQDKQLLSWGTDWDGELGNGSWWPQPVSPSLGEVLSFSSGTDFMVAVLKDGSLWSSGTNTDGKLGLGLLASVIIREPSRIGSDSDWMAVSAGYNHVIALKSDGSLWAWGRNQEGQLGDGGNLSQITPVRIGADTNWRRVYAGYNHTLALKTDGSLWSWGSNVNGELGDGTQTPQSSPVQVGSEFDWSEISASSHSLARKNNGSLWAWGLNTSGQLGVGSSQPVLVPTQIGTALNWAKFSAGQAHSLGLRNDGTLLAWGSNTWGETSIGSRNTPGQIGSETNWVDIAAGGQFTAALKSNGNLWTSGSGFVGRLGHGAGVERDAYNLFALTMVGSSTAYRTLPDGGIKLNGLLALTANGGLWGSGPSYSGALNRIRFHPAPKPVFADLSPQSVTALPVTIPPNGGPVQIQGTSSSGLPVRYKVSGSAVLNGNALTVTGSEPVNLVAWQDGDAVWDIAEPVIVPVYTAEIAVEYPTDTALIAGTSTLEFGSIGTGRSASKTLTIRNLGYGSLTNLAVSMSGTNGSDFSVSSLGSTIPPGGSVSFTISFNPTTGVSSPRTAALQILSNDVDESPFGIQLTGTAYSTVLDSDSDGLSDWTEFRLSALGFDWQTNNAALVASLTDAGLYTAPQVQDLNVGIPLLQRNPNTGEFTMTMSVEKSANVGTWNLFPMTAPQTIINGQGKLEFRFTTLDNAAFFRLKAE
jgi:alpha-tubulin suppressor-like RCC1 family protein